MLLKLVAVLILLGGVIFLCISCARSTPTVEAPIDQAWWDGLSEEWRTILLISQNLSKQHADIYAVQQGYMKIMHSSDEQDVSELNKSLHRLNAERMFRLSYRVQNDAFDYLDSPVLRVNQPDTSLPFTPTLIEASLLSMARTVRAVKEVMYLKYSGK